jgi:excisionase family DNA binding protein
MTDEIAISIPEAARRLALSPRTMATLVAQKAIPSRKIGRRRVVSVRDLEIFLRRDHSIASQKAEAQ